MTTELPLSVLQISDLHLLSKSGQKMCGINTEQSFCHTIKHAFSTHGKFDLILVTGDLSQTPCQFSYQRIVEELEKYQTKTVCLPGNHDDFELMQQLIQSDKINCNKLSQFKHWQIICLNSKKEGSEGGLLKPEELDFLDCSLSKNADKNTLIAVHHNSIPTKSRWLDTMTIENSQALFSVLSKHSNAKALICGHIHQKQETEKNNTLILGSPSTCFQFKPNSYDYALDDKTAGYRIFQLFSNGKINSTVYYLPSEFSS